MSTTKKASKLSQANRAGTPMVLVHSFAGMFNVLPGAGNQHTNRIAAACADRVLNPLSQAVRATGGMLQ